MPHQKTSGTEQERQSLWAKALAEKVTAIEEHRKINNNEPEIQLIGKKTIRVLIGTTIILFMAGIYFAWRHYHS